MINDEFVLLFTEHRNMSLITGTFAFERQTNFQNYLKELGVPYVLRTLAGIARPVVTISRDSQVHKYKKVHMELKKHDHNELIFSEHQ